ncbi:hypothetical protein WJX74_006774 [Apatococcus lobatus]|uniref:Uncharacterized protein n=1 Tax=Apatococcus lobatus TaxID=904363 RepID=A0AAW1RZ34_9CHLO
MVGRFQGDSQLKGMSVNLQAEESLLGSSPTADHQTMFIQVPPIPSNGVLYVDCIHDGRLSSSKQVVIVQDAGVQKDLQGLALSDLQGMKNICVSEVTMSLKWVEDSRKLQQLYTDMIAAATEDDIDDLVLDLGQVLPFAQPSTSSSSPGTPITQAEAAWICPVALRLVRFARSQNLLELAALIMPIASAGLALEGADDVMDINHQSLPVNEGDKPVPARQAETSSPAASAADRHFGNMPMPPLRLSTAVSLDLDMVPSPGTGMGVQLL